MTARDLLEDTVHELTHDVVVVGGGAAGLSAAVALARSLRTVVVVDAGAPRNAPSAHAHNVLGREGVSPLELLATGRAEATGYGAELRSDRAVDATRHDDGSIEVRLAGGDVLRARRLLLATGLTDVLPDVPGVRECWGSTVLHCPYCHGWEVRGQRIGILATSPMAGHQALLFRQLSADVNVFLHEQGGLDPDDAAKLAALGVPVVPGQVARLDHDGAGVRAVVLADGTSYALDAVVVGPRFVAQGDLYVRLGGTLTEHLLGEHVAPGLMGRTEVPGVWVAGNLADLGAMVAGAAAAGVLTGAAINADLVAEDATAAVVRAQVTTVVG